MEGIIAGGAERKAQVSQKMYFCPISNHQKDKTVLFDC